MVITVVNNQNELWFRVPAYPYHWAQRYYVPYASDADAIRQIINQDIAYVSSTALSTPVSKEMDFLSFQAPNFASGNYFSLNSAICLTYFLGIGET
ncbi:hypothetical protein OIU79_015314 [Salix purpurea]|uniref:Uncharacterized protein n=1 Tax=Salix purpurea TaxID=77065 RepID=A0A9Q0PBZ6_SALPP|nr:hypothetical protein OIU79_015314 [Salix purpurea]